MNMSLEDASILVTGCSGYIATHIVQQLQQAGHRVRGTVRSLQNEEKVKPLRELCPEAKHPVELVEADLTNPDCWVDVVRGCTFVIHTASPFPNNNPKDEMEVITPAVEGTLAVLRACREVGGVKRVVLTSSIAAIIGGTDANGTFTEENWSDCTKTTSPYTKSKTLAEKAAWDFVAAMTEEERFELSVLNPSFVMGPVLCGGWATSMEAPKKLLEHAMPALPHINFTVVDVRDVAAAHIVAMTVPEAAGKRHILSSHSPWLKETAAIYKEEFSPLGYNVTSWEAPYLLVWVMSFWDKTVRMILPAWGSVPQYNSTRMTTVLGIEPRPLKDTLLHMAYSMIEKGFIKKTNKYKEIKNEN